ncbi:M20/M25/M40 family metallo-hydrolase [Mangrovicella endophytica]|uniref:M20/M25/M40 family metallo-hydrolase n=1 Tax=Mangrovicella endophytica TaxID=2066697 RepID=UPI0012FFD795|nr:M20/M25/M40 family metallo-hydrolase [Mangrovicella endophytica]
MTASTADRDLSNLLALLRIPSHAGNADAKRAAAELCGSLLREAGFKVIFAGPAEAPAVIATLAGGGPGRLLFYNHYDVVPPGERSAWAHDPFEPLIEGDRLMARGASDHKASFISRLAAVRRLQAAGGAPVGITFLVDGEEEIGSPSLERIILSERERLQANGGLYSGGARAEDGSMAIRAGCKGRCGLRLTAGAGRQDNHSKWAAVLPSAAWRLVAALAAMRDEASGKVLVEGFEDGILGPDAADEAAMAALEFDRSAFLDAVGHDALRPEAEPDPMRASMFAPTFNIAWLGSGPGGGTVLPGSASALLDIRLVPGQTAAAMEERVRAHLSRHGFTDIEIKAEGGSDPDKCDLFDPVMVALDAACRRSGTPYHVHPMGAGSGPRHLFRRHLGYSLVQDPGCSWQGSNDHAANENIMIPHFHLNREIIADFLRLYRAAGARAGR